MTTARKVHEKSITNRFDDLAVIDTHCLLDELVMDIEQA